MNKKFLIGVLLVVVAVVAVSCRGNKDSKEETVVAEPEVTVAEPESTDKLGELLDDNTYIVRDTISIDTVLHTIIIRESLMYSMTRAEMISRRDEAINKAGEALKRGFTADNNQANFYISVANSYGDKLGLPRVKR